MAKKIIQRLSFLAVVLAIFLLTATSIKSLTLFNLETFIGNKTSILPEDLKVIIEKLSLMKCQNMKEKISYGPVVISQHIPSTFDFLKISKSLTKGGEYKPPCRNPDTVAIIVPYREREEQLNIFLGHLHPFIIKQGFIHYKIYIINQADSYDFNRASLMNVGFVEALKDFDWNCFIFHDVDHLPEDTRNFYSCTQDPRLMAVAVDRWNYTVIFPSYFGGVVSIMKYQYEKINGASNMFWGWGAEDDDLRNRILTSGMNASVGELNVARYTTIHHNPEKPNSDRLNILHEGWSSGRSLSDGLSSLKYTLKSKQYHNLFTNISVELNKQ